MTKTNTATKTAIWFISSCSLLWRKAEAGTGGRNNPEVTLPAGLICFTFSACFLRPMGAIMEASSQKWLLFPEDSILLLDDKNLASTQGLM